MKVLDEGIGKLIQPVDLDAFRKSNHSKPKQLIDKRMSEAEAVKRFIHDGDYVGTELYGTVRCPMSLVNEIVRQGVKDLRMAGQGVTELDTLLAAKLVKAGIPLRWADTHGEQCHVKMLYVEHADETATLLLGSCNLTRRNMDNFNAECDLALTAPLTDANMQRAREVFDRWWNNPDGRGYTVGYETYADPSLRRRIRAWLMETTGVGTF